jgi:predicted amidophosphoribosyltransferase
MSKEFCTDCGMPLSPHTRLCSVCGFDNAYENPDPAFREPFMTDSYDGSVPDVTPPEIYPGY